ncbi:hypothetical protein [Saliterribacillus persicus]|uniref:DUF1878 family protein n=1 Tax=Saliterribacillus persicus TaxID=930114 RepID=A0A368X3I4_9BACI|nr:hypothetical protein [Saliterribacillus persicus]RCW62582.1 hypothetical protein DFR57_12525 [Saliterribacillus persicus]
MDIEKEINLLKYQNKLLRMMVNGHEFPFFIYALDNEFEENQEKAIIHILTAFKYRLYHGTDVNYHTFHQLNKKDPALQSILAPYNINTDDLYQNKAPSIEEFLHYLNCMFGANKLNPRHLLLNLKRQSIHTEICEDLLKQLNRQ